MKPILLFLLSILYFNSHAQTQKICKASVLFGTHKVTLTCTGQGICQVDSILNNASVPVNFIASTFSQNEDSIMVYLELNLDSLSKYQNSQLKYFDKPGTKYPMGGFDFPSWLIGKLNLPDGITIRLPEDYTVQIPKADTKKKLMIELVGITIQQEQQTKNGRIIAKIISNNKKKSKKKKAK